MHKWIRRSRTTVAVGLATVLSAGVLAGCAGPTGAAKPDKHITVWSEENLPPQTAATQKIIDRFEKRTGITVKLVGVDENQLPQLIMSAAASGTLPDVMGAIPIGQVWQMYSNGLLNTKVATEAVDHLGRGTFNANSLRLTSDRGQDLAVPSDAWLQLLVYRKDLLSAAGLPVPDTYANLLKDARALRTSERAGASVATDPGDVFTQQSFEDLALADNCQLVDGKGKVTLESPACARTFQVYDTLAKDAGVAGTQTVDSTRATYFAGRSGMVLWSTSLLDELAGLRNDSLPSCPECKNDKQWLSSHSGVVTSLSGGQKVAPAQFGEVASWTVTKTAETAASREFIEYMLDHGYADWFGMSPEGQIPVRDGTAADPHKYLDTWRSTPIGLDTRKPLDKVYPRSLLDQLVAGVGHMQRWGFKQGQGALVGATNGRLPVPKAVSAMTGGQISPHDAAHESQNEVTALQQSLQ